MLSSTLSRRSWMRPWFILNPANCPSEVIAFYTWQTKAQTAGMDAPSGGCSGSQPKLALSLLVVTCKSTTRPTNATAAQAQYFSRERRIVLSGNVYAKKA